MIQKVVIRSLGAWLNILSRVDPARAARLGFRIFAHPQRQPVTRKHQAFFRTSEQLDFEHAGQRVQVYRWGKGDQSVLFLHGWQSHSYRWKRYIETFRDAGYTVYAFDAPAHGNSGGNMTTVPLYADTLDAFVRRHGIPGTIIGHSMGVFASLYALYRFPDILPQRLVGLAAPGEASEFLDHYQRQLGLTSRTRKILEEYFRERFNEPPEFFSAPFFARGLSIPGLLIHDENDNETSVLHSRRINEAWKGSRLITTTGLGHNLKSPEIVDQVFAFVDGRQHGQPAT